MMQSNIKIGIHSFTTTQPETSKLFVMAWISMCFPTLQLSWKLEQRNNAGLVSVADTTLRQSVFTPGRASWKNKYRCEKDIPGKGTIAKGL